MEIARRWGGQTASERQEERRDRLVAAAVTLFGEQGLRGTGVRAVCQAAGLTERYFYESFANREALLAAAFEAVVDGMAVAIRGAAVSGRPPEAQVRAMLLTYFTALRAQPQTTRFFLVEIAGASPEIDRAFEASLLRLSDPLIEALDPEARGPLARKPLLRRGLAGGLLHVALAWSQGGFAEPIETVLDAALRLCVVAQPEVVAQ